MKVLASRLDDVTRTFLGHNGIAIESVEPEDLEDYVRNGEYDAVIVDLEQTGLGVFAARAWRTFGVAVAIVGVSCGCEDRTWSDHRAIFLENGGDDLLRAPMNPREMVASLRAVTRRSRGALLDIFQATRGTATLKVNLTTQRFAINGRAFDLTGKEASLLFLFAGAPGRVLSKEMILQQMYTEGIDDEPEMKIIDVFVCKLRRKLQDAHPDAGAFIETVWGRGYRLTCDDASKVALTA